MKKKLKDIKQGELFKLKNTESAPVWVRGEYDRSSKRYSTYRYDDVCNFIIHGVEGEVIWHNTLQPDTFYGGWKTNEKLNSLFSKYRGIPHVREISYDDTLLKKINDKSAEVFRIKEKLSEAYKKQLAALSTIRSGKSTSENRKQQITAITKRISNIKKLMKKYE